jgi:hypothetical protein
MFFVSLVLGVALFLSFTSFTFYTQMCFFIYILRLLYSSSTKSLTSVWRPLFLSSKVKEQRLQIKHQEQSWAMCSSAKFISGDGEAHPVLCYGNIVWLKIMHGSVSFMKRKVFLFTKQTNRDSFSCLVL